MKKKKVQKLLSAAMMVSICVTMGAMPVSATSMDTGINQEDILTVGATQIENNGTDGKITDANQNTITWKYDEVTRTLTFTGDSTSPSTPNQNPEIEIPEKVIDKIVNTQTTSGSAITWEKDNVENLKINGTVTSIATKAFDDCTNLKEVTIYGDITTIGDKAFIDCTNLETVEFLSPLKEIGMEAFANCENLADVELPTTIETIGNRAFSRCYALTGIDLPDSLTTIGWGVFDGTQEGFDEDGKIIADKVDIAHQSHFTDILPPYSQKNLVIDDYGLVYDKDEKTLCCALKNQSSLVLPETLSKVNAYAFSGCVADEITFTGKKPDFDKLAFSMYKFEGAEPGTYYRLKATAYYPGDDESWKGIENEDVGGDITWKPYEKNAIEGVYEGCKWVYNLDSKTFTISSNDGKPVEIPDFESYDQTPWAMDPDAKAEIEKNCNTIVIADDITRVGNASFGKLFVQVENITFSQNLKSIGKDAFVACGAGTKKAPQFTLPDSLETIEDGAFASLEEFTEITIPKEVKELASTAFLGCNKLTTVKVAEDNENLCAIDDVVYDKKVTTLVFCPPTKEKVEMPQSISRVAAKSFVGCESLKEIKFTGNAPDFEDNCFILSETDEKTTPLKITAYYPTGNSTWTEDKLKDYGGKIKWEAYNIGTEPGSDSSNHVVYHYDLETHGGTWDGTHYYLPNGTLVTDAFFCDGTYTYYLQFDGTPMKGRLAYHPDGRHVIYFDDEGHEVFNTFANVKQDAKGNPVDDLCYFNVYGFMYVNVLTYDQAGKNLYYANVNGVMERNGWFKFPENNIGYANADGTLVVSQFSKDAMGRTVYFQANGKLAKGLITDGVTYYKMDETDGHLVGTFVK